MKGFSLVLSLVFLLLGLFGCGVDKGSSSDDVIKISKDINKMTITGNGLREFIEDGKEQMNNRKVVFEQEKEIEVMLKAIKNSEPYSGPMTDEGENFNLIIEYKDHTSETIHLWLYTEKGTSRIKKASDETSIQLLGQEDVQNIAKLLAGKLS